MEYIERGITMRRYGLLDLLFEGAVAAADYIADERREKRGEMQRNNTYLGDISGNRTLEFAELLRTDMENEKAMRSSTEQELRDSYNFSNRNTGMDDLFSGTQQQSSPSPAPVQSYESSPSVQKYDGVPDFGGTSPAEPPERSSRGGKNSHGFWSD
jgi:hypothetical protein